MNRTLTVKEIAEKLDLTEAWVRTLARRGVIPATKKGITPGKWLFNEEEVKKAYFIDNVFV